LPERQGSSAQVDRRHFKGMVFLAALVVILVAWWFTPAGDWLTLAYLREAQVELARMVEAHPIISTASFFLLCAALTSCCFPAAPIIGIAAGALFGFWAGLAIVLVATTIGSTAAFHMSRTLLRGWIDARFGHRMAAIDRGFAAHGPAYLLALRFNPLIPYWLVNLTMGLTAMRPRIYVPLTLIGLTPATTIYAHAGTQLARIESASDVFTPTLIGALLLLCLFPLIAEALRTRFSSSG
jgi:uncharacterized membrane protein YdjX (TVP38/TMEM64 family)